MRNLLLGCLLIISASALAQTEAKFSLQDGSQKMQCYHGNIAKDEAVKFKNTSSCNSGNCAYVWNYGDSSADSMKIVSSLDKGVEHAYAQDGLFKPSLMVIDLKTLPETLKTIDSWESAEYISTTDDSVNLSISYFDDANAKQQKVVRIPMKDYSKKSLSYSIEVFSPYMSETNFKYQIEDPSTETDKAAIKSFVYIFSVNTDDFKPHNNDVWKYYWSFYDGKNETTIDSDSTELRHIFTKENYKPGYIVSLKIALDSTKLDLSNEEIEIYNLQECVASQSLTVEVTDQFFTESTRKNDDVSSRETVMPNVFTPGGNDENDVFYFNTNGINNFTIWIYNSDGNLVYQQEAKSISWTGDDNSGFKCPSGTYYYVLKSDSADKRHNTTGYIQLFRQN